MATGPLSARLRQLRYMVGLLRYDEPQTLTPAQRTQARANIGAADASTAALAERRVNAGTALVGGGDMTQDRTINADLATQAEAQAGTSNTKLMTPQRTAQAIAALQPKDAGAVGTYAMLRLVVTEIARPGDTWPGSALRYATADGRMSHPGVPNPGPVAPGGTWRCMGFSSPFDGTDDGPDTTTLWMRVS